MDLNFGFGCDLFKEDFIKTVWGYDFISHKNSKGSAKHPEQIGWYLIQQQSLWEVLFLIKLYSIASVRKNGAQKNLSHWCWSEWHERTLPT